MLPASHAELPLSTATTLLTIMCCFANNTEFLL